MKDDRRRIPVDKAYLAAIGMAAYCFATMEWNAVYCGEKLRPGFVNEIAKKTAGEIANHVAGFAKFITDEDKRARYESAAVEFQRLVRRRNDLMHANPATVGSDQRLVRQGTPWQTSEIDDLADEFTACSIELNELLHYIL